MGRDTHTQIEKLLTSIFRIPVCSESFVCVTYGIIHLSKHGLMNSQPAFCGNNDSRNFTWLSSKRSPQNYFFKLITQEEFSRCESRVGKKKCVYRKILANAISELIVLFLILLGLFLKERGEKSVDAKRCQERKSWDLLDLLAFLNVWLFIRYSL